MDVNGGLSGVEIKAAGLCGRRAGKDDVIERIGAKAVFAFVEPKETRNGEPSGIGSELGFVIVAPIFDRLAIGGRVRGDDACEEQKESEASTQTMKVHGMLPLSANRKSTKKMACQPGAVARRLSGKRKVPGASNSGACEGVPRRQE